MAIEKAQDSTAPTGAASALSAGLCNTGGPVESFFDPSWIKTSEYPADFVPSGAVVIDQASEDGDCTVAVKGFYDPKTGEFHIQEVMHNV